MIKILIFIILISILQDSYAQKKTYKDSILTYQQHYIKNLKVIGDSDRKYLSFYPVDKSYRVVASFKRIIDTAGFDMNTSSGKKKKYFIYGLLSFKIRDSLLQLYVYQPEELMKHKKLKDYLLVPFGDATSGFESYGGGRYIDFNIPDLKKNKIVLDFNKAYNPYCAYTTGFNCPIPPMENLLNFSIRAGEKEYGKPAH